MLSTGIPKHMASLEFDLTIPCFQLYYFAPKASSRPGSLPWLPMVEYMGTVGK